MREKNFPSVFALAFCPVHGLSFAMFFSDIENPSVKIKFEFKVVNYNRSLKTIYKSIEIGQKHIKTKHQDEAKVYQPNR